MDALDDDILKPKKKSTASGGKASTPSPQSKPDPTPSESEQPSAKPKGEINIYHTVTAFNADGSMLRLSEMRSSRVHECETQTNGRRKLL